MTTILLIGNNPDTFETVQQAIAGCPYSFSHHPTVDPMLGESNYTADKLADLVILAQEPLETIYTCRQIRGTPGWLRVPILCLTRITSAADVAHILDSGADDCVSYPLMVREVAARIRAVLRRPRRSPRGSLIFNAAKKSVQVQDRSIELTPTEYTLLEVLSQRPGEHIPVARLLEQVWHYPPGTGDPALVRNHVRNLRRKLESDPDRPQIVVSAHGRGYAVSVEIQRRSVAM